MTSMPSRNRTHALRRTLKTGATATRTGMVSTRMVVTDSLRDLDDR